MSTITPDSGLKLPTDPGAQVSRITSASKLRQCVQAMVDANQKRNGRNALLEGLVDGNPPYDASKLAAAGQKGRANFNTGEAEAFLEAAISAYYDVESEVDSLAVVRCDVDDQRAFEWGRIVSEEFDRLLKSDSSWDYHTQLRIREMVMFGCGPMVFLDEWTWKPTARANKTVYVPKKTPSDVNQWDRVAFVYDYTVDELYRYVQNEDAATRAGWDVAAVKEVIKTAAQESGATYGSGDWQALQEEIRANDFAVGEQVKVVKVAQVLFRELNGKITEAWLAMSDDKDRFLFKRVGRYDRWTQVVVPFYYSRGTGRHHEVRGLGQKQFNPLITMMRMTNGTVDSAFARMKILFKPTGSGKASMEIVNLGPYGIMPGGFDFVNTNVGGVLDAPIAVSQELERKLQSNLAQYRTQPIGRNKGNPPTATQIQADLSKESALGKTQLTRYYTSLDTLYDEVFKRVINPKLGKEHDCWADVSAFRKRCSDRGVGMDVLKKCSAKANRAIGQGSQWLRTNALEGILPIASSLPEQGRKALLDDFIAAKAGQEKVSRYNPRVEQPTNEDAWAAMENTILQLGGQAIVTEEQDDFVHLRIHMPFLGQAVASLSEGANPDGVLRALEAGGVHVMQHLDRLGPDLIRSQEAKMYLAQVKQLSGIADKLRAQMEADVQAKIQAEQQAQQAQAVQSGMDPAVQLDWAKAQHDMALKEYKAKGQMRLKEAKTSQDMAIKDATTAAGVMRQAEAADVQAIAPIA